MRYRIVLALAAVTLTGCFDGPTAPRAKPTCADWKPLPVTNAAGATDTIEVCIKVERR